MLRHSPAKLIVCKWYRSWYNFSCSSNKEKKYTSRNSLYVEWKQMVLNLIVTYIDEEKARWLRKKMQVW